MFKFVEDFLDQCLVDYESMKRGTYAGFLPLAIMAGAMLAKRVAANRAANSAGKEANRVEGEKIENQFKSDTASEENFENNRINRTSFLGGQLTGKRAIPPEVLAAALARRKSTVQKGVKTDRTKGLGWGLVGDVAGSVGEMASGYMAGKPLASAGGSEATSLRPPIGGGPVSMGGQSFDFAPKPCPPGQIC